MRLILAAAALVLCACGDKLIYRPLEVDIDGVSSQAQKLVLEAFPESSGQSCSGVGLASVQMLKAPFSATWTRGVNADRKLSLPSINEPSLTLVVYTEDMGGAPIQYSCEQIMYSAIETGVINVRLNTQSALLLYSPPWRRSSDRSSSSGCSGAAGWRRCTSPTARTNPHDRWS